VPADPIGDPKAIVSMHKGIPAAAFASLGAAATVVAAGVVVGPFLIILAPFVAAFPLLLAAAGAGFVVAVVISMSWALSRAQASGRVAPDVSATATVTGAFFGLLFGLLLARLGLWPLLWHGMRVAVLAIPAVSLVAGAVAGASLAPRWRLAGFASATAALVLGIGLVAARVSSLFGEPGDMFRVPASAAAGPAPAARYLSLAMASVRSVGADGTIVATDYTHKRFSVMGLDEAPRWSWSSLEPLSIAHGANGDTIVRAREGHVTAFDAQGRVRWDYDPRPEEVTVLGAAPDGTVFTLDKLYNTRNAIVRAIDPSGRVRDVLGTTADAHALALSRDGGLFAITDGEIRRFDTEGRELWHTPTKLGSRMVAAPDGVVVAGYDSVRAIDDSGRERWSLSLSVARGSGIVHLTVTPSGRVYASSSSLWAIENGREIWRWNRAWLMSAPVVDGEGTVYARDEAANIYAIGHDGTLRWMWQSEARPNDDNGSRREMWVTDGRTLIAAAGSRYAAFDLGRREARATR
jgi:hypothetical protein